MITILGKILTISRPKFWMYTLGPYIIGISAASHLDTFSHAYIWYGLFYFLLPANIFIYSVNDYFDASVDIHNPKKYIHETHMKSHDKKLYLSLILISALLSVPLFFIQSSVTLTLTTFLCFGYFYSSPPFRFKSKVCIDSISNFFYILPGIIGYIFVTGILPRYDITLAASLWAMAMHLFSAIVDIEADTKTGIKTTATLLGYKLSLCLTSLIWLASIWLVVPYSPLLLIGLMYPIVPLYLLFKKSDITDIYWMFPWMNTFLGFILFCIVILDNVLHH